MFLPYCSQGGKVPAERQIPLYRSSPLHGAGGGSEGAAAATQSHEAPTATSPTGTAAGMQKGRFAAWGAMIELGGRSNSARRHS